MFKEELEAILNDPINFVIGGIIHAFWFLIIPEFFILGYMDRKMQSKSYGINALPRWSKWQNLLLRGLKLFSIIAIYLIPPLILTIAFAPRFDFQNQTEYKNITFEPLYVLSILLFLALSFVLIGALASYIKREKIIDAFNIREIFFIMSTQPKKYIETYLIGMLLGPFSLIAMVIPIAGLFIFGFVNFFILLVFSDLIAELGGAKVEESKGFQTQEGYYY